MSVACNTANIMKILNAYEKQIKNEKQYHKKEWLEGYEQAIKNIKFTIAMNVED